MREAGVNAPAISRRPRARFRLLSTRHTTYLQTLTEDNADHLFADALED